MGLLSALTGFTRSQQDAEDAIQDTHVYQLTHPKLTDRLFSTKAFNVAKRNYSKKKRYVPIPLWAIEGDVVEGDGPNTGAEPTVVPQIPDHLSQVMAAEQCAKIRATLSPRKQVLFDWLLAFGGNCSDAAHHSGIKLANFKTLIFDLRHGRTKDHT